MTKRNIIMAVVLVIMLAAVFTAAPAAAQEQKTEKKMSPQEIKQQYDLAFEKAMVHYEKADLLYEKKKLAETAKELEAIVALEFPEGMENSDGALMQLDMFDYLGQVYLEMGKPEKAAEVLEAGIKKAPPVGKQAYHLYMSYGHVLKTMKKTEAALAAFEKAEKINTQLTKAEKKKEIKSAK